MVQKNTESRGRPRSFEPDKAVAQAQGVFWAEGLAAASLDQLSRAMQLHKPSIYAAFGNKGKLYLACLDAYLAMTGRMVAAALSAPDLRTAIRDFFDKDLDLFMADGGRGCFLLLTAVPAARKVPEIAVRVTQANGELKKALQARLEKAKREGELAATVDPDAISGLLHSLHMALALRARAGETRAALDQSVQQAISVLLGEEATRSA